MALVAIIGGSGLSQLGNLEATQRRVARTPYGEPSGALTFGRIAGRDVVFLARHGYGHTIAPHEVNYRANIWALKDAGAECVVSVASVGGIRSDIAPGMLVLPDQIIDYTWGRSSTYFEGAGVPVNHIDFTVPYSAQLRKRVLQAAAACKEEIFDGGVYAATQGPRLETAAEITRLERDGAHIVGMTGMPEAASPSPACAAGCRATPGSNTPATTSTASASCARYPAFMPASSSTSATTLTASSIQ